LTTGHNPEHAPEHEPEYNQPGERTGLWLWIGAGLLFALLTVPVWRWLWGEWMHNEYYSHGPLVAGVAAYLAWRRLYLRRQAGDALPVASDNRGVLLLGMSLLAYLWFYQDRAYFLSAFAMIGILAGGVWSLGGGGMLRLTAFPLAYLTLMVPLPVIERATLPLALWTGLCSGNLAQWLGLDVMIQGAAVTLPNANLVVGAQCSGINSIMALTALMILLAYVVKGPLWGKAILAGMAVPLALLGNILRVTNLIVVARFAGVDAAFTFYHDLSGPLFFGIVLVLLFPLTRAVKCSELRLDLL